MKNYLSYIGLFAITSLFLMGPVAMAAGCGTGSATADGITTLCNPIASNTVGQFLTNILDIVLMLATPILTIAFLWCGFKFILAKGNPTELATAKNNLLWTLVGAAIVIGVKVLVALITDTVGSILG